MNATNPGVDALVPEVMMDMLSIKFGRNFLGENIHISGQNRTESPEGMRACLSYPCPFRAKYSSYPDSSRINFALEKVHVYMSDGERTEFEESRLLHFSRFASHPLFLSIHEEN